MGARFLRVPREDHGKKRKIKLVLVFLFSSSFNVSECNLFFFDFFFDRSYLGAPLSKHTGERRD